MTVADAILQKKCQELTRTHLTRALSELFTDCTGLRYHVSWSPPPPLAWNGALPAGCASCLKRLGSTPSAKAECHNCVAKHVAVALQSGPKGHSFTCALGIANCWVPITVQTLCLGIVCFQTMQNCESLKRGVSGVKSAAGCGGLHGASGIQNRPGLPVLSKSQFNRAARLLRLIVHDAVETDLAELEQDELQHARRSLSVCEKTETRLRRELHQVLPALRGNAAILATDSHDQQIVHQMLEFIHQNCGRPVQLKGCAEKMRMNPAYLSTLFSHTVGLPFKKYLTELRLEKAQQLLSDPRQTIADVAYGIGYTDPNRFRLAFKQWAGLPPSAWRGSPQARTTGH